MTRKCMIFAAGLGTRLRPLTDTMPKALVPVGGKPLLQHLLEKLHHTGFDDVVINVHHFADMIEDFVPTLPLTGKMRVQFSDERQALLETGGGIRKAAPMLSDAPRFLIHNVDILSNVDLNAFWAQGEGCDAVLLVSERVTQRYLLFDDKMRLVGWTNVKTGEVKTPYEHLEVSACHKLAFAGIHQMGAQMLPLMSEWEERFSIIDFYLRYCATHDIRGYVQPNLKLMDVGKLDTLSEADDFVANI